MFILTVLPDIKLNQVNIIFYTLSKFSIIWWEMLLFTNFNSFMYNIKHNPLNIDFYMDKRLFHTGNNTEYCRILLIQMNEFKYMNLSWI